MTGGGLFQRERFMVRVLTLLTEEPRPNDGRPTLAESPLTWELGHFFRFT